MRHVGAGTAVGRSADQPVVHANLDAANATIVDRPTVHWNRAGNARIGRTSIDGAESRHDIGQSQFLVQAINAFPRVLPFADEDVCIHFLRLTGLDAEERSRQQVERRILFLAVRVGEPRIGQFRIGLRRPQHQADIVPVDPAAPELGGDDLGTPVMRQGHPPHGRRSHRPRGVAAVADEAVERRAHVGERKFLVGGTVIVAPHIGEPVAEMDRAAVADKSDPGFGDHVGRHRVACAAALVVRVPLYQPGLHIDGVVPERIGDRQVGGVMRVRWRRIPAGVIRIAGRRQSIAVVERNADETAAVMVVDEVLAGEPDLADRAAPALVDANPHLSAVDENGAPTVGEFGRDSGGLG